MARIADGDPALGTAHYKKERATIDFLRAVAPMGTRRTDANITPKSPIFSSISFPHARSTAKHIPPLHL